MELNVKSTDLLKALQAVIGLVERKQTMPILSHVLFETSTDGLSLTSTDQQMEMTYVLSEVDCTEHVRVAVPAKKLFDITKALPTNSVMELQLKPGSLVVKSQGSEFSLLTQAAESFPVFQKNTDAVGVAVPVSLVKQLCNQTIFSVSAKHFRTCLTGLLLKIEIDHLVAVSSDGHRMAVARGVIGVSGEADLVDMQVIVPKKAVVELLRLPEVEASLVLTEHQIEIVSDHFVFCSRLIDAEFPDYHLVMPQGEAAMFRVKPSLLQESLSRVSIMANENNRGVCLLFSNQSLRLQACNKEYETADESIDIEYEGGELEGFYKVDYLLDILGVVASTDELEGMLYLESKILIFKQAQQGRQDIFMVMPLTV